MSNAKVVSIATEALWVSAQTDVSRKKRTKKSVAMGVSAYLAVVTPGFAQKKMRVKKTVIAVMDSTATKAF